jgi:hypothetical protein
MKLIAVYSVFDGEELLEHSINSIRNCVDYILVIYQKESNFGIISDTVEPKVIELKNKGLIDEIMFFKTIKQNPLINEITKRNLGVERAKELGFTHFLTVDCDEFYFKSDFEKAKNFIKNNDIDTSVCWVQNYHKKPEYKIVGLSEPFKVPFINKLYPNTQLILGGQYFTDMVDPTRITNTKNKNYFFDKETIMMHHYTTIRKDIRKKYESWTCRLNYKNDNVIDEKANKIINYNIETDEPKCELVENYFNIKL